MRDTRVPRHMIEGVAKNNQARSRRRKESRAAKHDARIAGRFVPEVAQALPIAIRALVLDFVVQFGGGCDGRLRPWVRFPDALLRNASHYFRTHHYAAGHCAWLAEPFVNELEEEARRLAAAQPRPVAQWKTARGVRIQEDQEILREAESGGYQSRSVWSVNCWSHHTGIRKARMTPPSIRVTAADQLRRSLH